MRFLDLFAGAGFIRRGVERAGHKCIGYVEWDKYARKSYEAIHNTEGEWTAHDITTVTDESVRQLGRDYGPIHIITGGFPCQAFSIAGLRKGFEDARGTLFFEIARFASILRPKYLLLENVDGLRSHNEGRTLATILYILGQLDYDVQAQVLNSKDFGVPQNRERIFFACFNRDFGTESRPQVFPIIGGNGQAVKQIIGGSQGNRVYDPRGIGCTLSGEGGGQGAKTGLYMIADDGPGRTRRVRKDITPPIRAQGGGDTPGIWVFADVVHDPDKKYTLDTWATQSILRPRNQPPGGGMFKEEYAGSLDTNCNIGVTQGYQIRKITPRECWRLQGTSDEVFDKAASVNSDSQLYKQAGNGATETVVYEIARRLS